MKAVDECSVSAHCDPKANQRIEVQIVGPEEIERFDRLMAEKHYLGATRAVGDFLRQVVLVDGQWVALLTWGAAAYKLKDREQWIGWTDAQRVERLKLIVQNRRFLLLVDRGQRPNLASQTLSASLRVLPKQWREHFGYAPLIAESFTDPESFAGTCYKASGWEPVGFSQGYSRHSSNCQHRSDFYLANERPKRLWLKELHPQARQRICALTLDPRDRPAVVASVGDISPLQEPQMLSLAKVFTRASDPRASNTHFRIGPVLTIVAMALLAGARDVAHIARFASRLTPRQRAQLALPIKAGTRRFYKVPAYNVFYRVLKRLDPETFAQLLSGWLQAHAGELPVALALDGKMIRDQIGMVTLAQHEDGCPVAVAVMDQKEGTKRCEQTSAQQLIESLPNLDGKVVTADALHCQKATARAIVEKGGDYVLQVKANQPSILERAKTLTANNTPLLSTPKKLTVDSKNAV